MQKIFWLIVVTITASIPIVAIKQYNLTNDLKWLGLALMLYAILILAYINLIHGQQISIIYTIAQLLGTLLVVLIGVGVYGETLTTSQTIGLIMSLYVIYLLS